jgi:hypothetical protein
MRLLYQKVALYVLRLRCSKRQTFNVNRVKTMKICIRSFYDLEVYQNAYKAMLIVY